MSLTVTIPGAVEATVGSTAPATLVLQLGVPGPAGSTGSPGQGVAAGGTTGQALVKASGDDYDTTWTTITADDKLPLAGGTMTGPIVFDGTSGQYISKGNFDTSRGGNYGISLVCSIGYEFNWQAGWLTTTNQGSITPRPLYLDSLAGTTLRAWNSATDEGTEVTHNSIVINSDPTYDSELAGWGLGVELSADHTQGTTVEYNGLNVYDGAGNMRVTPTGLTFPDASVQSTAFNLPGVTSEGNNTLVIAPSSGYNYVKIDAGLINVFTGDEWSVGQTTITGSYIAIGGVTAATINDLASYAPLASPVFTGDARAPTPATSDNDTSIATTAYVKAQAFGDRYLSSSTTSNTISNGNKTFTIGTGLSYTPTQNITISYDATHHMHGEVLTYSTSTGVLTVDINNHTGSGTYAAWVVNVGGVTPATTIAWGDITGTLSTQTDLQNALNLKANLASPTFTGTVTIPSGASISGFAPLASPTFTGTVTIPSGASISGFAPLASPTFTGTPTLPTGTIGVTQTAADSTTALATTAFVTTANNLKANLASPTFTGTPLSTTPSIDTNTTQIATTAFVRDMLSDCTWSVPPISTTTTATSGTGSSYVNIPPDTGYLTGPNANTAGYCQKGMQMFARSNSTYGFNYTKEMRIACKMAINWTSTFTAITYTLIQRLGNSGTGALGVVGFGITINMATKVLSIVAHNGTTLTTKTTSWVAPTSGIASIDFMVKSDGTGTVYAYADGVLIDSTTGMATTTTSSNSSMFAAVEINSAGGTSTANATGYISNLRTLVAHG